MSIGRTSPYRWGALMVACSAVAWSTAGLFTKGVAADVWAVLFWRGLLSLAIILIYIRWRDRAALLAGFAGLGTSGWAVATISSAATFAYIAAFKHTAIANVAVIYATAPLVAAALAWLWMRERPRRTTLSASVFALLGVGVMVGGSVGTANLVGDGLAILMTIGMAMVIVMIRRYPSAPLVHAIGLSSLQLTVVGWLMTDPLAIPLREIGVLLLFGVVFAVAVVLLTEGARLIPASETALLGALEMPLAPIWAWLLLSEIPAWTTLGGGGLVVVALLWHQSRVTRPAGSSNAGPGPTLR